MLLCDVCQRAYHQHCLPPAGGGDKLPEEEEKEEWVCQECTSKGYTESMLTHPKHEDPTQPYMMQWEDTPEDVTALREMGLDDLITSYHQKNEAERQEKSRKKATRALNRPTNLEAQGIHKQVNNQVYDITVGQNIRKKLVVHLEPINPHKDTHPTGQYQLHQRVVLMQHGKDRHQPELVCVNRPDGTTVGTLTPKTVKVLYQRFQVASNKPALRQKLKPASFPEEVARLITRYKEGAPVPGQQDAKANPKQQWTTPTEVYKVLKEHFGLTKERFASPLNSHTDLKYWSAHERDQLFGAHWDAYKSKWTGPSVASPAHENAAMAKAMAWAVRSAQATAAPTLTILLLPALEGKDSSHAAYNKWKDKAPGYVRHLLQIPKAWFKYTTPAEWETSIQSDKPATGDINVFLVGNKRGFEAYAECIRSNEARTRLLDDLRPTLKPLKKVKQVTSAMLTSAWKSQHEPPDTNQQTRTHKKLAKLPPDVDSEQIIGPMTAQAAIPLWTPEPLRYDWEKFAYTDGSVIKDSEGASKGPGYGAGVYIPGDLEESLAIDPGGAATDRTINRAELAAILVAIQNNQKLIATDSLTSMHQIMRYALRPQDMREHRHADLLQDIVDKIAAVPAQEQVHLFKVKSHDGIVGNEKADELAVGVSKGEIHPTVGVNTQSNHRYRMHWPATKPPDPPQNTRKRGRASEDEEGQPPQGRPGIPIPNLTDALKKAMHEKHRMGTSNQETVYYKAWRDCKVPIHGKMSNAYFKSAKLSRKEICNVLRLRTGGLYTQKLAYRFKHAPTDRCLLCGQQDGGHHAVSACPKMSKVVTLRHNEMARILTQAISQGGKGAQIVAADIGKSKYMEDMDMGGLLSRVPKELLAGLQGSAPAIDVTSIPDAIMVEYHTTNKKRQKAGADGRVKRITLIEYKYCRDTDPTGQLDRATLQHETLLSTLRHLHPSAAVAQVTIRMGVAGAVYEETLGQLEGLGVDSRAAKRALQRAHIQTIKCLTSIIRYRRICERKARKGTPKGVT